MSQTDVPPLPIRILAGGLGTGYVPYASGTAGSALAVALYALIPGFTAWPPLAVASMILLVAGIPMASVMERHYGNDPKEVVLDEIVGQWIALLFLPAVWWIVLGSFLAFRFFDIVKPPPARQLDRMHGGFGIMMDDVAAAIYANVVMQVVALLASRMHLLP